MVLRNARGPQHHPYHGEHPSCQKPDPTLAPHKHRHYLSTEGSEHVFFRDRGRGGRVLTCFEYKINGGEDSVSTLRPKL